MNTFILVLCLLVPSAFSADDKEKQPKFKAVEMPKVPEGEFGKKGPHAVEMPQTGDVVPKGQRKLKPGETESEYQYADQKIASDEGSRKSVEEENPIECYAGNAPNKGAIPKPKALCSNKVSYCEYPNASCSGGIEDEPSKCKGTPAKGAKCWHKVGGLGRVVCDSVNGACPSVNDCVKAKLSKKLVKALGSEEAFDLIRMQDESAPAWDAVK